MWNLHDKDTQLCPFYASVCIKGVWLYKLIVFQIRNKTQQGDLFQLFS